MNKIREFREKADLTQVELALLLGVSNKAISHYEVGNRMPSLDTIKKLATALHCKPTDLFPVLAG